jgi:hypothetical protein
MNKTVRQSIEMRPRRLIVLVPLILFIGLIALLLVRLNAGDPSLIPSALMVIRYRSRSKEQCQRHDAEYLEGDPRIGRAPHDLVEHGKRKKEDRPAARSICASPRRLIRTTS